MIVSGTLLNVGTVLVGTVIGTLFGERLPERIRVTVMHALGLLTLVLGIEQALAFSRPPLSTLTRGSFLIVMGAVLVGGIVGEMLHIEDGLDRAGEALKRRFGQGQARFTEGFVVASLVFCVGPLTILGSFQNGANGDIQLLAIKSVLDGFAAMAFASALGWGVGFSVITILLYQGTLSVLAAVLGDSLSPETVAAMTAAGGLLIMGIGLRLLDLVKIRLANLLPALVLAPLGVALFQALR
jgi:uncharacterized membrane protein YqgA involved in biofilm formation